MGTRDAGAAEFLGAREIDLGKRRLIYARVEEKEKENGRVRATTESLDESSHQSSPFLGLYA